MKNISFARYFFISRGKPMANLGADFSISAHIGTAPQQPGLVKLWHASCTNVDPLELVFLANNFTPAQVATFAAHARTGGNLRGCCPGHAGC